MARPLTHGLHPPTVLTLPPEPARESQAITRADFDLKPFMTSSNRLALWQIANTLIPYGLLWGIAAWSHRQAPWLLLPVMALMMLFLARCFSLMHDCGHGSLFRNRRANRIAGFVLGAVSGIPQLPWSRGHAFHHRHNGDWEKYQGPSALVTTTRFQALSPTRRWIYRALRHPLMLFPGGFFYLVIKPRLALILGLGELMPHAIGCLQRSPQMAFGTILATHKSRHWHSPEEFLDLLLNNLVVISLWVVMGFLMGAAPFWLTYGPVMSGAAAIFICIFFVQHNFPGSYAHPTAGWSELAGALEGTSDLDLPALLNWFSADIGCHSIHHLCAAIPNYRLRACHNRNKPLLRGVTRLALSDVPACFGYILWDPSACRLTTPAASGCA
jgi:omega-6 fatty acid desaturase (delta-12 desaturase)